MPLFLCRRWGRDAHGARGPDAWPGCAPTETVRTYKMPEADLPLVPLLRDFL